jgi:hypothetical protein
LCDIHYGRPIHAFDLATSFSHPLVLHVSFPLLGIIHPLYKRGCRMTAKKEIEVRRLVA